jgi:hypothetical protein
LDKTIDKNPLEAKAIEIKSTSANSNTYALPKELTLLKKP